MAYKQQPKSPVLKALVGDQHKLPKVLKDAIMASPAKQSAYKGGGAKTDAQMTDRQRRVNEGLTVRRNDYAPGKEGQASFNADRKASFNNRREKHASIRTRLQSGEITKQDAMSERNAYAKDIQKSASNKRTKADRNMGDAPTTFIVSRKGIKRKVSDAEKASYSSVAKKYKK